MTYTIRLLTADDAAAAHRLGSIAFGYPDEPAPPPAEPRPGRLSWGAFDEDGTLVGKATDRAQAHWFGGRLVPATGVAGVAIAAEHRGRGLSTELMTHLTHRARERGAVIGTLYDTTPWPYRRVGWEEIGARQTWGAATAGLAGIRTPKDVAVRSATAADVPAVIDLFRRVARDGCAVMDRGAPVMDDTADEWLADVHGTSVAVDQDGIVQGFCGWNRSGGYRDGGKLEIGDLFALTPGALTALLAMIGSWASVAPRLEITLPSQDPFWLCAGLTDVTLVGRDPWMLRLIDAVAAVEARGWPDHVSGSVDLDIDDPTCPWNTGPHRLVVADGRGTLTPGGTAAIGLGARGLASLYAGAATPALLRRAGMITGGDAASDAFLRAVTAGPTPHLHDYF